MSRHFSGNYVNVLGNVQLCIYCIGLTAKHAAIKTVSNFLRFITCGMVFGTILYYIFFNFKAVSIVLQVHFIRFCQKK